MGATVKEILNKSLELNEIKSYSSRQTFLLKTKKLKSLPLTCKKAAELLLSGDLKKKICRFCLKTASPLSELDQYMEIGKESVYKVTIRDMIGSFYPVQIQKQPHIPSKICENCLNKTISCYLFAQQCDQAERAMVNFIEDIDEKINKLDSLEVPKKKRGRQKLNPNYNLIKPEHVNVIDYAEPKINIVNRGSALFVAEQAKTLHPFECLKCWEVLPNVESLLNHEKIHPKTMCFNCRFCGQSFKKRSKIKHHLKNHANTDVRENQIQTKFLCKDCGLRSEEYGAHLQHIEKHKFQAVFEHLVERKLDNLCSICFEKRGQLMDLDGMVSLHGGYPLLTGDRSIISVVQATVPDISSPHSITSNKICNKCLNSAIETFVFINHTHYVRNRLHVCLNQTLEGLNKVKDEFNSSLFVEINKETILPSQDDRYLENAMAIAEEIISDDELEVDVLEDEFREDPKVSSDDDDDKDIKKESEVNDIEKDKIFDTVRDSIEGFNLAKKAIKTYTKKNMVNGFPSKRVTFGDVTCSEFLTFKKKTKKKVRYSCQICNKSFITEYHFVRHSLRHVKKTVKCHDCGKICESKFEFREHNKMAHVLKKSTYGTCRICHRAFTNDNQLSKHVRCHLKPQCQLCEKMFATQKMLQNHMQRHGPKLSVRKQGINCSFCEKLCTDDNQLSLHVNKSHLQIKPYHCDMCEAQFYTDKNLGFHKKVHSLKRREKCEFCSKTLKCRKSLVIHVRKHIGVKPWQCNVCEMAFYSESKLFHHMNNKHGGRFICNCCKVVYSNQNDLKLHVDTAHVTKIEPNFYINVFDS